MRHLITVMAICAFCLGGALAGSYTVQPGDTAFSIATRFGIKPDELLRRNGLTTAALRVGQVLDVPDLKPDTPVTRHTVAPGETLFSIAKKYGSSVEAIRNANKLADAPLKVGQVLIVPAATAIAAPAPASSAPASSPPPQPPTVRPKPPVSSPAAPGSTVTVKPSPPPLPNLGTPPNASSGANPSSSPTPKPSAPSPSTVTGANVKPTATAPIPPEPLPRGTITLPPPDANNPFAQVLEPASTDVPIRTASSAPLPDLGAPPNAPPDPSAADPSSTSGTLTDPASAAGTVGQEPEILHSVARGDTLSSISRRYGVEVSAIRQVNNLSSDAISIGQILKIPVLTQPAPLTTSAATGVRDVSERYLGVTYRFGGASSDGLDCSGFVVIVFTELGIRLPRTSAQQFAFGQPVERTDLRLGDLVFFNTTGQGVSHVGIYLSDGEFIHAASNPGRVIKSRLEEKYYAQRYLGARRVMTDD